MIEMTVNYDGRIFKPVQSTENSETSNETIFRYQQHENILTSTYLGGRIKFGHLLGIVNEDGSIDMQYHQVNDRGELMTGTCHSTPEVMANGKLRLHEAWQWTSGDLSTGNSVLEEQ